MKRILNACPLFAIIFFVRKMLCIDQLRCYYRLSLCHSLVRSVMLLGIVQQVYNIAACCSSSLRGWRIFIARPQPVASIEAKAIFWRNRMVHHCGDCALSLRGRHAVNARPPKRSVHCIAFCLNK